MEKNSAKLHFLQFRKWPKINFWTGKKFKTAKNAISRKNFFWFIWFYEFFCLDFLNFLADCEPIPHYGRLKNFLVNTSWALYQLNVLVFWTLVMPVVHKILIKNFLQKLPDFSGTNRFFIVFYSVKLPKLGSGKIGHFLKKNIGRKFINYWHHKSPKNHHIEFVEGPGGVLFFFHVAYRP